MLLFRGWLSVAAVFRFGIGLILALAGVDLVACVGRWFCIGPFLLDHQDGDEDAEYGQSQYERNHILHYIK